MALSDHVFVFFTIFIFHLLISHHPFLHPYLSISFCFSSFRPSSLGRARAAIGIVTFAISNSTSFLSLLLPLSTDHHHLKSSISHHHPSICRSHLPFGERIWMMELKGAKWGSSRFQIFFHKWPRQLWSMQWCRSFARRNWKSVCVSIFPSSLTFNHDGGFDYGFIDTLGKSFKQGDILNDFNLWLNTSTWLFIFLPFSCRN